MASEVPAHWRHMCRPSPLVARRAHESAPAGISRRCSRKSRGRCGPVQEQRRAQQPVGARTPHVAAPHPSRGSRGNTVQHPRLRRSEGRWRAGLYAGFCTGGSAEPPAAAIPLGRRLPAGSSGLPGGVCGRAVLLLSGLAPGGVCRAARVAPGAGALLPHRFTLACAGPLRRPVPPSAVCSLWHFPAGRPDWVLPSTVPGGVRTFLGPVRRSARYAATRPARHRLYCRAPAGGLPPGSPGRACRRDARYPPSMPRAVEITRNPKI